MTGLTLIKMCNAIRMKVFSSAQPVFLRIHIYLWRRNFLSTNKILG